MSGARGLVTLLWIAFAVLVAAVLWIVLAACGLAWPGGWPMLVACPIVAASADVDPALAAEHERQRALQRAVRDLEVALIERPYCTPQQEADVQPDPGPGPEPSPSIEETIREGEVEALEGCWEQVSDLSLEVRETGELITVASWEVCFADDGRGSQTMVFTSGVQCSGPVIASFADDDTLQIADTDHIPCDNGSYNVASTTTCKLAGGETAECIRSDQDNSQNAAPVTMRRAGR